MKTKTPTKIDNIKNLYSKVNKKTQFIEDCAEALGKSPLSLRAHWFAVFWSIPEEYQDKVITILQNTINNQKA